MALAHETSGLVLAGRYHVIVGYVLREIALGVKIRETVRIEIAAVKGSGPIVTGCNIQSSSNAAYQLFDVCCRLYFG